MSKTATSGQMAAEIQSRRKSFAGSRAVEIFRDDALGVVAYQHESADAVYLMGFSGRSTKPDFNFRFRSLERATQYREQWHARLVKRAEVKEVRRAANAVQNKQPQTVLQVGDVLVSCWGYEQTNYDYYEVTRLVGKRSVEIRELARSVAETQWLQGDCVPLKGHYVGKPMIRRVNNSGTVKVQDWGVWATKKECTKAGGVELFAPDHFTAYA